MKSTSPSMKTYLERGRMEVDLDVYGGLMEVYGGLMVDLWFSGSVDVWWFFMVVQCGTIGG